VCNADQKRGNSKQTHQLHHFRHWNPREYWQVHSTKIIRENLPSVKIDEIHVTTNLNIQVL
jgi:hypothetical protein